MAYRFALPGVIESVFRPAGGDISSTPPPGDDRHRQS
ncbi:hypothetical protein J3R03_000110 [Actinoplanes couchii]|nr:hypothetical protein [Actinoplanes couchii]